MESMSWPLTPKSHSLISPRELTSMLEGLTSTWQRGHGQKQMRITFKRRGSSSYCVSSVIPLAYKFLYAREGTDLLLNYT